MARARREGDSGTVRSLMGERTRLGGSEAYQQACEEGTRGSGFNSTVWVFQELRHHGVLGRDGSGRHEGGTEEGEPRQHGKRRRGGLRGSALRERRRLEKEKGRGPGQKEEKPVRKVDEEGKVQTSRGAEQRQGESGGGAQRALPRILDVGSYMNAFVGVGNQVPAPAPPSTSLSALVDGA